MVLPPEDGAIEPARAPRTLRELAVAAGIDEHEIDEAELDGTLGLLIVDHTVIPEPGVYTQDEIVARSGLGEDARRFWRALGFPDPHPEERIFSQIDLEMLQLVDAVLRLELIEHDVALQMARVIGSSMQRIAQSHIDGIEAQVDATGPVLEQHAAQRAALLLPTVPKILEYAWRRHLQGAARRRLVREAMAGRETELCVGFADLVGFTALSQQLDDDELVDVVDRFEATAYDLVAKHGGRVVKMIGDEVMFEVEDAYEALVLALDLAAAYHDDEAMSDVRVGVARGPVLAREGDLYGPVVNLASRVVSIAYAGSVVVSNEVRERVEEDPRAEGRFVWKALRTRYLKHIGRVQLHSVRLADDVGESAFDRARRRRGAIRDRVADIVDRTRAGAGSAADEPEEPTP